jgi:HEAT repeat protein
MEALLAALLGLQDPAALVERLRSDTIEEREQAFLRLEELGRTAIPLLERAARDPDEEVSRRARELLVRIPAREHLTPAVIRTVPGAVDRVARGDAADVFVEIDEDLRRAAAERRFGALGPADLEKLLPAALGQARGAGGRFAVCEAAGRRGLRTGFAEMVALLRDETLRSCAAQTLRRLEAREAVGALLPLTGDADPQARMAAAALLRDLGARDQARAFVPLLRDPNATVRSIAVHALSRFGATEAVPDLRALLRDESGDVRWWAVRALADLRAREAAPEIAALRADPSPLVRRAAEEALASLGQ